MPARIQWFHPIKLIHLVLSCAHCALTFKDSRSCLAHSTHAWTKQNWMTMRSSWLALTGISRPQTSPPSLQFNWMQILVATDINICFLANVRANTTWLGTGHKQHNIHNNTFASTRLLIGCVNKLITTPTRLPVSHYIKETCNSTINILANEIKLLIKFLRIKVRIT